MYATDALPPITVAGLRFLLATLVMLVWCLWERVSFRVRPGQWRPIIIAGTLLYLQIATFTVGTAWTSSSHASLFVNTFVFWVVGMEHFLTKTDRLSPRRGAGLLLAAVGVFALLLTTAKPAVQSDPPSLAGDAMLLFSALILGIKFIYTKQALRVIGPTELIFWHDIVAVLQFAVTATWFEQPDFSRVGSAATWGLLYQGIAVGGICFALQAHLLRQHSASQIAVFSFLTPIVGICLGMLFRGDQLSTSLILAAITVAAGIYLVNREPPRPPTMK
jgi:drug/metabolite transporter (DMT)-like permease